MAGEEILIADATAHDREALMTLARKLGLVPSVADTAAMAREKASAKFYAVALVDLDLPGGGLEVFDFFRQRSHATQVILICARKSFDAAVGAFRTGAVDVIYKRPEEMARLQLAMETAVTRYQSSAGLGLREVADVLDELMKTVLTLGRDVYKNEIAAFTEGAAQSMSVLFVEEDQKFLKDMSDLIGKLQVEAYVELSGGGALDKCGEHTFDIVVARQTLMDLPGQIVMNAAQARNPECIGLLYTTPGPGGRIDRMVEGRVMDTYTPFTSAKHIAERVRIVIEEEATRRRERKVLQIVGSKHADLLRRYADAKKKIEGLRE